MLTMLFYSLDQEQAYKDFWTSYMSFALQALILIYLRLKSWSLAWTKGNQEAFDLDKDQIEITQEYKYLGFDLYAHLLLLAI